MNNLNKSRYFYLLAKDKDLQLKESSLYESNRSEYSELLDYKIILSDQVFYDNRFQYINLIQNYLDDKINCSEFQVNFFELYQNHNEIVDKLIETSRQSGPGFDISFSTDSKMKTFSLLVDKLIYPTDALSDGLKEETFAQRVKEVYSEIEKLIN